MTAAGPGAPWLAVLGRPIAHSISPFLHEAGLAAIGRPGASLAIDVGPSLFPAALDWLRTAGWVGGNVTAPHKELALACAVSATEAARRAGSANCLRRTDAGHEATNTDGAGFLAFLEEVGADVKGMPVVLLGGGGAAAGLVPPLEDAGAVLTVVARRPERSREYAGLQNVATASWDSPDAQRAIGAAALVVNATPLGSADSDALPCSPDAMATSAVAVDLRYGPSSSPWVTAVRDSGRHAHDGLGLLLQQCALSFRYWFDDAPAVARLREAVPWIGSGSDSAA